MDVMAKLAVAGLIAMTLLPLFAGSAAALRSLGVSETTTNLMW